MPQTFNGFAGEKNSMMDNKIIDQLLKKYFQGETNLEEEKQLRQYFTDIKQIDAAFKSYAPWFEYIKENQHVVSSKTITMPKHDVVTIHQKKHSYRWVIAMAAAVTLLLIATFMLQQQPPKSNEVAIDWSKYELQDDAEASAQIVAALKLLAEKLNGGTSKVATELDKISKISTILNQE